MTAMAFIPPHHPPPLVVSHGRASLTRPSCRSLTRAKFRRWKRSEQLHETVGRLSMSLVPLDVGTLQQLLSTRAPSAEQYASYLGRSNRERYDRFLESAIVTFLGTTFSYFMSFVLGSFVATIFGTLFLFWGVLSPELKAYQRNWEFIGGRRLVDPPEYNDDYDERPRGLYGALYVGRIESISVVEDARSPEEFLLDDFVDYDMDQDPLEKATGSPYLLRVACCDNMGRSLQVHARMSPEYLVLQPDMLVTAVLLSKSPEFETLAALTDLYVPDEDVWIGDYPYLDRVETKRLWLEDEEVYEAILEEEIDTEIETNDIGGTVNDGSYPGSSGMNESYGEDEGYRSDDDLVLARRGRRRRYQ